MNLFEHLVLNSNVTCRYVCSLWYDHCFGFADVQLEPFSITYVVYDVYKSLQFLFDNCNFSTTKGSGSVLLLETEGRQHTIACWIHEQVHPGPLTTSNEFATWTQYPDRQPTIMWWGRRWMLQRKRAKIMQLSPMIWPFAYEASSIQAFETHCLTMLIMLGNFHIELAFYGAVGTLINKSGIEFIFTEADILAEGSMAGFIKGKFYNRCTRIH